MYLDAKTRYAELGIDTEEVIERLKQVPISLHVWQADDVNGFVNKQALSGGIQTTGNYPGKATSFEQVKKDLEFAYSLIPGKKRLNLHAIYAVSNDKVEMDKLSIKEFEPWLAWAKEHDIMLDFNPTLFSSPYVKDGLTLSSPDEEIRQYWVRHVKTSRAIAAEIGKRQGSPCLNNIWIPDGFKDVPADRMGPRLRLKKSLDEIFEVKYDKRYIIDAIESKVFGIGVESYTVGSSEFYMNYAALNGLCCLLDNGHYHPTEVVSDKIPSMLCFFDKVALHVTRGVRWDSDHVVTFEDELKEIAKEIVRNDALDKVIIGLDYFDASINRVLAMVMGDRNMSKALCYAMLIPHAKLKKLQDEGNFTELLYWNERIKTLPFGEVYDEYLRRCGVKVDFLEDIKEYERKELSKR